MLWLLIIRSGLYDMGTANRNAWGGGGVMSAQHDWSYQPITLQQGGKRLHLQHQTHGPKKKRHQPFFTLIWWYHPYRRHHVQHFLLHHPTCPNNAQTQQLRLSINISVLQGSYCLSAVYSQVSQKKLVLRHRHRFRPQVTWIYGW